MPSDQDKIKNLEDALRIVDDSNLPPAPTSDRPFPVRSNPQRVPSASRPPEKDKYGIPVTRQSANSGSTAPKETGQRNATQRHTTQRSTTPKTSSHRTGKTHLVSTSKKSIEPTLSQEKSKFFSLKNVLPTSEAGIPKKVQEFDFMPNGKMVKSGEAGQELDIGTPEFKIKFDFESAYRDVPEDKPIRLRREKRTGLVGGILLAVFVICVSLVLASLA